MRKTLLDGLGYCLISIVCFYSSMSTADVAATEPEAKLADISLLQVMMPLLLVIVLIFALAWIVKKMKIGTPTLGQGITVVASSPLSNQARVCLIKVGEKDILLGVTNQHVSLIHTFEESPMPIPNNENAGDFSGHFINLLKRNKTPDDRQKT